MHQLHKLEGVISCDGCTWLLRTESTICVTW